MKLAAHLQPAARRGRKAASRERRRMLYLFDEPTTGLHFDDISKLLAAFRRLIEAGGSILVIEHNLEVIKTADWVIDLGPEGGERGGNIVGEGPPEKIAELAGSYTGNIWRRCWTEWSFAVEWESLKLRKPCCDGVAARPGVAIAAGGRSMFGRAQSLRFPQCCTGTTVDPVTAIQPAVTKRDRSGGGETLWRRRRSRRTRPRRGVDQKDYAAPSRC